MLRGMKRSVILPGKTFYLNTKMIKSKVSVYFDGLAINRVIVFWETVGKRLFRSLKTLHKAPVAPTRKRGYEVMILCTSPSFDVSLKIFPVR